MALDWKCGLFGEQWACSIYYRSPNDRKIPLQLALLLKNRICNGYHTVGLLIKLVVFYENYVFFFSFYFCSFRIFLKSIINFWQVLYSELIWEVILSKTGNCNQNHFCNWQATIKSDSFMEIHKGFPLALIDNTDIPYYSSFNTYKPDSLFIE